jgi:ligand-binding sensor domain-containing protein
MNKILVLIFLYTSNLFSQSGFDNYTKENGLPSNEVYRIFQDKKGYVWFATDRGLANFDGIKFKKFDIEDGLPEISVIKIFPQKNGQIWGCTFGKKLFYIDNETSGFHTYKYNNKLLEVIKKYKRAVGEIKDVKTTGNNEIIVSFFNCVFRIDKNGKETILNNEVSNKNYSFLKENKYKNVSFYSTNTYNGFFKISHSNFNSRFEILKVNSSCCVLMNDTSVSLINPLTGVSKIITFKNRTAVLLGMFDEKSFWVSFRGKGYKRYDLKGNELDSFDFNFTVTDIKKDLFKGFWISTLEKGVFYKRNLLVKNSDKISESVNSLTKDANGNLVVGTTLGNVCSIGNNNFKVIYKSQNKFVSVVEFDCKSQRLIIASDRKIFTDDKLFFKNISALKISDDNENSTHLSCVSLFKKIDGHTIKDINFNVRISDVSEINNSIYIATLEGLKIFKNNKLYSFKHPLLNIRTDDIDYNPNTQNLYLATLGFGVVVYNVKTGSIFSIKKSKGLSDNIVTEVYIENNNTVWACTNFGLNRIVFLPNHTQKINYITSADGLASDQIKDVQIIQDDIFIGTPNGLSSITKKDFDKLQGSKKFYFRISKFEVNNKKQDLNKINNSSFSHNQNKLDFHLDAISISGKENLEFKYKLNGLNEKWFLTKNKKITYEYIPPGEYIFEAHIYEDGKLNSNEKIVLKFNIKKPFWETSWFVLLVFSFFGLLIYSFFKVRVLIYNKDLVREFLRIIIKKIKKEEKYIVIRDYGRDVKIYTNDILFVKSDRNYIEIQTVKSKHLMRFKIGDFIDFVPDSLEFLRIHRSYIIRIDKISQKNKKSVFIDKLEIPVGENYLEELEKIVF